MILGRASVALTIVLVASSNRGAVAARNTKKGVSFAQTQSCAALEGHTTSSWWYSWSAGSSGYNGSFCNDPTGSATAAARAAGMEFVPMFWGGVPTVTAGSQLEANLLQASYLMTFNEPEQAGQANLAPAVAASMWSDVVDIANIYNLEIVGPCMTSGGPGRQWYDLFVSECEILYGSSIGCRTEYTCIHQYYKPYPCAADVADWACIGNGASRAINEINYWYTTYGNKPIWVTEFACAPWGGGGVCSPTMHTELMNQIVPVLEGSSRVFRYAWYTAYEATIDWQGASLNELVWTLKSGVGCPGRKWLKGWNGGTKDHAACVAKADADVECYAPLTLSIDDDACYCSRDACQAPSSTWSAMRTYYEIGVRDSNALTSIGELYNAEPTASPTPAPLPSTTTTTMTIAATTTTVSAIVCANIATKSECQATASCKWQGSPSNGLCKNS